METWYTIQLNEKTKKLIIVKNIIHESNTSFEPKKDCYMVSTWYKKRSQANAVKTFLEFYIQDQQETIFNWKYDGEKLGFFWDSLDYCIQDFNK